jgi:hypothetical protein
MRYYADGDHKLICVDFPADKVGLPLSRVTAHKYRGGKGWIDPEDIGRDSHSLAVEALYSGNYYMVDEAEARRIMAVLDTERSKAVQ